MSCPDLYSGWGRAYFGEQGTWTGSAWQYYWSGIEGYWYRPIIRGTVFQDSLDISITVSSLTPEDVATVFALYITNVFGSPIHSYNDYVIHPGVGNDYVYTASFTGGADIANIHIFFGEVGGGSEYLIKDITFTPCPTVPDNVTPPLWEDSYWNWDDLDPLSWNVGCAEWEAYGIEYGTLQLAPHSLWATGYRPGAVTISGPNIDAWFTAAGDVSIVVTDTNGGTIGSLLTTPGSDNSYTIPLSFSTYDFGAITLQGAEDTALTLCDVLFGSGGCTSFWTNHTGQQEVSP